MTVTSAQRRVATYERVSSEDQAERGTIKTQTDALIERLQSDPAATLVHRFSDDGVSGTVPLEQRAAGLLLMEAARNHEFDELLVYRGDRLGRDAVDMLYVRRELERLGIKIVTVVSGEQDPLTFDLLSVIADYERTVFLRRSADGMNRAAREGRYTGGIVPYGFKAEGERPRAVLVPDDSLAWGTLSAADVVRKIYRHLAEDGLSCRQVADELNDLGVPTAYKRDGRGVRGQRTRAVWRAGRIRNLVVNPVYRGELSYGRRSNTSGRPVITAVITGIVPDELWQAAQETLAKNRLLPKNTRRTYLLRSTIVCARCGLNFVAVRGRDDIVWYRCGGRHLERGRLEGKCPSRQIKGKYLEDPIWADIERFLRNPDCGVLDELSVEASDGSERAALIEELKTLEAAMTACDLRRNRLIDAFSRGRLTEEDLDTTLPEIKAEQKHIQNRTQAIRERMEDHQASSEPIPDELLDRIRQRLDSGDISDGEKQEIISLLVRRIVAHTYEVEGEKLVRAEIEYAFPRSVQISTGTDSSLPPS